MYFAIILYNEHYTKKGNTPIPNVFLIIYFLAISSSKLYKVSVAICALKYVRERDFSLRLYIVKYLT